MKKLIAITFLSTVGALSLAPTAQAQSGQLSINIQGSTQEENDLIALGLGLYALSQAMDDDANVRQDGMNNLAGIAQSGFCNFSLIEQQGNNHNGSISQDGNCNSYGLFQFGEGTNNHVTQTGNSNSGITLAFGF